MVRKRTGRVQFLALLRLWTGPPQNNNNNVEHARSAMSISINILFPRSVYETYAHQHSNRQTKKGQ